MKMKRLIVATLLCTGAMVGSASAQMYVGAGAGSAKTDTKETSYKLFGGFQFSPTWGLEFGYTDLRKYRGANIEASSIAGTGTLVLNEYWSLLGKLGASSNRSQFSGSKRHTDVLVGLGVGYSMNKNTGVRLEYEDFGKLSDVSTGSNSRGKNLGLAVKYTF
jgi:OmpA-OmpF porin, OOP family